MAGKSNRPARELTAGGFGMRLLGALLLVLATYNPSDYSFVDWVQSTMGNAEAALGPEHFFVGVLLLIGWAIYLAASYKSLGPVGMVLAAAFFATLIWLLIDFGILSVESGTTVTWIVLVCLAGLLAIGVTWSHIWRRLTGQFEVDED